jgi:hypothetical protein
MMASDRGVQLEEENVMFLCFYASAAPFFKFVSHVFIGFFFFPLQAKPADLLRANGMQKEETRKRGRWATHQTKPTPPSIPQRCRTAAAW